VAWLFLLFCFALYLFHHLVSAECWLWFSFSCYFGFNFGCGFGFGFGCGFNFGFGWIQFRFRFRF
jgi:hypothetical protein